jgi:K+-sensing histidine kinase KdpD
MPRLMIRRLCFCVLVLVAGSALAQTEFSANIVTSNKQGTGKIYFAKDKLRIDAQEQNSPTHMGVFIADLAKQTTIILMPQQQMYMEMPVQMMQQRGLYSFFRTGDVENACADWEKVPHHKVGSCHKVGSETVNGRSTVKYEGTNESGEVGQMWLDPKLRFPVKWQEKNNGGELRDIQEGSQPASLFEIPAGYTKMDIGGMTQHRPH